MNEAITEFNRENIGSLRTAISEALAEVGLRFDVHLSMGRGKFTPANVRMELIAAVINEQGDALTPTRQAYFDHCTRYGLKTEWLDATFEAANGQAYTITGLTTRSHTYPILATRGDGTKVKLSAATVKALAAKAGK